MKASKSYSKQPVCRYAVKIRRQYADDPESNSEEIFEPGDRLPLPSWSSRVVGDREFHSLHFTVGLCEVNVWRMY